MPAVPSWLWFIIAAILIIVLIMLVGGSVNVNL